MLGLFGPKSGKIGVYKAAFIYQGPFKEDFSAGSPAINEVVIESCVRLMKGEEKRSINIGNPHEMSVLEIARMVIEISSSESELVYEGLPEDYPKRLCPQIRRVKETLGWKPWIGGARGCTRP